MSMRGIAMGGALAVVAALTFASSASAVLGLERVTATSPASSFAKDVTATCPSGKLLIGGGGEIVDGGGQVVINDLAPNGTLTSNRVTAQEDENGTDANWAVTSHAICASALERVTATSGSDSFSAKSASASCPTGKRLLGGGGDIGNGLGQVVIDDLTPSSALTSVTVTGVEDENGYRGNWTVTAYAICAVAPTGLELVTATSSYDSVNKSVVATCPYGKHVVGTGGEITGGSGQVVIHRVSPDVTLTSNRVTGVEDETGTAADWTVRAYAICVPLSGLERVSATSPPSSSAKGIGATCPSGKLLIGAGGEITGAAGQVVIDGLSPNSTPTSVKVRAFEDETGTAADWAVSAYAICAPAPSAVERVSATSAHDSKTTDVTATCPAGKSVVGVGGAIGGGGGQVVMDILRPVGALTSNLVLGEEDENFYPYDWTLTAYAICAGAPYGLERVAATSASDSSSSKSVSASCPPGKKVVGAAGEINGGTGEVVLDDITPDPRLTYVTVTGAEDENGHLTSWTVTAYAICAF